MVKANSYVCTHVHELSILHVFTAYGLCIRTGRALHRGRYLFLFVSTNRTQSNPIEMMIRTDVRMYNCICTNNILLNCILCVHTYMTICMYVQICTYKKSKFDRFKIYVYTPYKKCFYLLKYTFRKTHK